MTFKNNTISVSTNTTTFTDISSWLNDVKLTGGDRELATEFVFGSDTALVLTGKRKPIDLELIVLYTEGVTDPFEQFIRPAYETSTPTPLYFKWLPRGSTVAAGTIFSYVTDACWVITPPYPQGKAQANEVTKFITKVTCTTVTKSTSTT